MGEPTPQEPRRPGIPGFAASFASTSRLRGDRDAPSAVSRVLTAGLAIVVVGAVVVGAGLLVNYERGKNSSNRHQTAQLTVDGVSSSPTGRATASTTRRTSASNPPHQLAAPLSSPSATTSPVNGGQATGSSKSTSGGSPNKPPSPSPLTTQRIIGVGSNRCLDVADHIYSAPPGTALQIYDCGNNPNQKWALYTDQTIRSLGLCLSVGGGATADGSPAEVNTCDGSAGEKWNVTSADDIVNITSDKCLDVKDSSTANGARLQIWTCAGTSNQKWRSG
ncbi:MAG: hypothetical protein QOF84_6796 [Streptomyces sp.]|nr:hypothetical protein [Streptomyces sp.]MDX6352006.1 hypothetical protein [Streptomyces sp.]